MGTKIEISKYSLTFFFLASSLPLLAQSALPPSDPSTRAQYDRCEGIIAGTARKVRAQDYEDCSDFYIGHADYDRPLGGFFKVTKINHLYFKAHKTEIDLYQLVAWLEWSSYINWKHDPEKIGPGGATRADEAIATIREGERVYMADAHYHYESAKTLELGAFHPKWPIKEWIAVIEDQYQIAMRLAGDNKNLTIYCQLGMARNARRQGDNVKARAWYELVLQSDPTNEIARDAIKYLDKEEGKPS